MSGLTIDFELKKDNVNNYLGQNWYDIWNKMDTGGIGFVKADFAANWISENVENFDGFFKPMIGSDGKLKMKVFTRAFAHVTLRDGTHSNTNVYDYEWRRLLRYMVLMNELSLLCGELEAEDKTLNKEDFKKACTALFQGIDDPTLEKAFKNIDDLGGNKWANDLIGFDEFCHYAFCVMDA